MWSHISQAVEYNLLYYVKMSFRPCYGNCASGDRILAVFYGVDEQRQLVSSVLENIIDVFVMNTKWYMHALLCLSFSFSTWFVKIVVQI